MAFTKPELTAESDLDALLKDAQDAAKNIKGDDLTDEQADELETIAQTITEIKGAQTAAAQAAAEKQARIEAARAAIDGANADADTDTEGDAPAEDAPAEDAPVEDEAAAVETDAPIDTPIADEPTGDEDTNPADVVIPDDISALTEEQEPVVASAAKKSTAATVREVTPQAEQPIVGRARNTGTATIVASADVPGVPSGKQLTMGEVTAAFNSRVKAFPKNRQTGPSVTQRHGVASIQKEIDPKFHVSGREGGEAVFDMIREVAKEARLPGGSLVAAGGWCAPSEQVYTLPDGLETVSGIFSIPEITVQHGGLKWTKGPEFDTLYENFGFIQTEAQAEAKTEKTFEEIDCPPFEEERLDAIGFGIRAGILQDVGWPEITRWYLDKSLIAHAHKVNGEKIKRTEALITDTLAPTALGSTAVDSLGALELAATRMRYRNRMDINATLEVVGPLWFHAVARADIAARRGERNQLAVTDAEIDGWFRARSLNVQWVYDWQDLAGNAVAYPTTAKFMLYPAGTFVAGTTPVIDIDAVYDYDSLKVNTYTATFFEEGLMVINQAYSGTVVTVNTANYNGRVGPDTLGVVAPVA